MSVWETYRNLRMVLEDDYSKKQGMNLQNTLVLECDPRRIQYCLPNTICSSEYTEDDAFGRPRLYNGVEQVLDENWQRTHMVDLGNYIMDLLDKADDVPKYLAANITQFTPPNLLGKMS